MMTRFIVSARYDRFFFIFQPLVALLLGLGLSVSFLSSWMTTLTGVVTMSHLVIVFYRSHANAEIFRRHPKRFLWVGPILFGAMALSSWVLVAIFVLSVWWDVYHSSLQTFGLGRMYDQRAGNDPRVGRQWDRALNLFLYLGPVLAGVSLADHVSHFHRFADVGSAFFSHVPAYAMGHQKILTWSVLGSGGLFLLIYVLRYHQLSKTGYQISQEKIWLYALTGLCSIVTWGFNPFGQAFFVMNFFHAVQYFALVWFAEKKSIRRAYGISGADEHSDKKALGYFIVTALAYGVWAELWGQRDHYGMSLVLTVSILHFWYDGFIWSVRRKEV